MFSSLLMIEVWPNARETAQPAHSLGTNTRPRRRLVQQRHSPTGAGKPSTLFEPRLGGGLHDIWLDVFSQAGTDLSQSPLRRFVLAVDEMSGELRQHDGMVAEHAIGAEVCRAAIQQVGDGCRLPTGSSGRAYLARPARRCIR